MKTLIQLGCNVGKDLVRDFLTENPFDYILLIDANPYCIEHVKDSYKGVDNVHYEVAAVADIEKDAMFYIPHFDMFKTSAHSSLIKEHVLKHGHNESQMKAMAVKCKTFTQIMEEHNLTSLTRLYIDCEGEDSNIIRSLELKRFRIEFIMYEHGHASAEDQKSCQDFLKAHGYTLEIVGGDTIATL